LKNKKQNFEDILELLREDLGVHYSNIIDDENINIIISGFDTLSATHYKKWLTVFFQ